LQPQLNKAVSLEEKDIKGDKNPKDFVLFFAADFAVSQTVKDNTGSREYIEGMVFPTLKFPSDHGITATVLLELSPEESQPRLRYSNADLENNATRHKRHSNLAHSLRFE
jgi:hypothetical protein